MEQESTGYHFGLLFLGLPPHPDPGRFVVNKDRRQACIWVQHVGCHAGNTTDPTCGTNKLYSTHCSQGYCWHYIGK